MPVQLLIYSYADDMVVLALSWHALQSILVVVEDAASQINMSFNTKKTACFQMSLRSLNACNDA